ncbi:hypothetical protein [Ruminococcus sp.]|uniref:hypothetical protein n=1 Tax=Ruminococcus sp. TaxID=41978 RepID=UPI003F0DB8BD
MAEKEYIEKSKLISDIECIDICDCTDIDDIFIEVERTIDEQPTADVQKVRHGKNVTPFHPADEFICSECGVAFKEMSEYIIEDDVYREFYFKFCPNCGAKMDKT